MKQDTLFLLIFVHKVLILNFKTKVSSIVIVSQNSNFLAKILTMISQIKEIVHSSQEALLAILLIIINLFSQNSRNLIRTIKI